MVEHLVANQVVGVRFSLPAQNANVRVKALALLHFVAGRENRKTERAKPCVARARVGVRSEYLELSKAGLSEGEGGGVAEFRFCGIVPRKSYRRGQNICDEST